MLRVAGSLEADGEPPLTDEIINQLAEQMMSERHHQEFKERYRADIAYASPKLGRFRVNVYVKRGSPAIVIRRVNTRIPSFEELRLPPVVAQLALAPRGLVLVTGQTGSGKSTTLGQTLERLFHFFPQERHSGMAMQLSLNLNGIISQRLVSRKDGNGRVAAVEIVPASPRVRELLRKADLPGVRSVMQSPSAIQEGMHTFDYALYQLIREELIDTETGMSAAHSPNDLRLRLKGLL